MMSGTILGSIFTFTFASTEGGEERGGAGRGTSSGKRSGITGCVGVGEISGGTTESGGREGGRELGNERATACFMKLRRYVSCSFISLFSVSSSSIFAVTCRID